jgi:hypothetical protein
MKKTITFLILALGISVTRAQTVVTDFETFTLSPNSAYSPTTSTPFQANNVSFDYKWDAGFSYWSGGFSYTNKYDSITAGFGNMYGVRPLKGFNNSNTYVVGKDRGLVSLSAAQTTVNGFYITNTTYAYKSMAKGDAFARKFGDTTGTGSGTTIPQGSYPDYFKVVIKGYNNGALKNDSVTVLLADFTFTNNAQDFILATWQYVSLISLGEVDSIKFFMRSSDSGSFGINTPGFFGMDNFTIDGPASVGIVAQTSEGLKLKAFPNPFNSSLKIISEASFENTLKVTLTDVSGKIVFAQDLSQQETELDLTALESGIYFLAVNNGTQKSINKIIKN